MTPPMAAAVLVAAPAGGLRSAPPGVDPGEWWRALVGDTLDVVAALSAVRPTVAVAAAVGADDVRALTWPGTPLVLLPEEAASGGAVVATLDALAGLGFALAVVLAADLPDLPGLLVGKLFSALEDAPVSVSPARGGGLCGLGARLPAPTWLRDARADLDAPDALDRLHDAAPVKGVVVGPGWHRLREPTDIRHLDANLEGWDAVRALLSAP
ncbi:MAG TPA: DUF2064 domain-containing protein [Mycobacteriales bacterium]|nr:DUF2064 domain-containing protein [Mycobacteriales bacterium]